MKTVHLISGGDTGGARTHVLRLLGELNKTENTPLLSLGEGTLAEAAGERGIPCETLRGSFFAQLRAAKRYIRAGGFEVVRCHGSRANLTGALLRRSICVPVVSTVHSDHRLDYLRRPFARLVYGTLNALSLRRMDALVCVSDAMREIYAKRGFRRAKLFSVYNGADMTAPRPAKGREAWLAAHGIAVQPDGILAGTAARFSPVKDLSTMLRGFAAAAKDENAPIVLGVQDEDKNLAALEGPAPDDAGDVELTEAGLCEAMYRTAGTPFRCTEVRVQSPEGKKLRVSGIELDEARRRLLYKLSEERSKLPDRKEGEFPEPARPAAAPHLPAINFSFQTAAQMTPEMAALCPECVYVPLELLCENPAAADPFRESGAEIVAALPLAAFGETEENTLRSMLAKVHDAGITQALTGNLGLAMMAGQEGFRIRGDFDLAVMNGYTLSAMASAGFLSAMLSPELTFADIREMPKCMDAELAVYGRLPVMATQTCLLKASAGRCTCTTPGQLADTHGGVWPVTKHFGCRNTVWAARKLWLGDVTQEWIDLGLWAVRLCFSTESARECLEVAGSYIQGTHYKPNGITRGLYYRGVL